MPPLETSAVDGSKIRQKCSLEDLVLFRQSCKIPAQQACGHDEAGHRYDKDTKVSWEHPRQQATGEVGRDQQGFQTPGPAEGPEPGD